MATAPIATHHTPEELLKIEDGHRFELIDGQLVERNMGAESSHVGAVAIRLVGGHASAHGLGSVFGPNCGYQIFSDDSSRVRYPDGSFIRRGRLPNDKPPKGHVRIPPDLALEVVSPNDAAWEIDQRVEDFLQAGTRLVWVIYPETRRVHVHRQGGSSSRLTTTDELTGEDVLPGFRCPVSDLFQGL